MKPGLDKLVDLAHAHAKAEADGDIDATLATLEDEPVYELLPIVLTFRGRTAARQYYEHFFGVFRPSAVGSKLRNEWAGKNGGCSGIPDRPAKLRRHDRAVPGAGHLDVRRARIVGRAPLCL